MEHDNFDGGWLTDDLPDVSAAADLVDEDYESPGEPNFRENLGFTGLLTATVTCPPDELDDAVIEGMDIEARSDGVLVATRENLFVNTGLQLALDRLFGLGGTAATHIAVSSDNTTYELTDTTLGGTTSFKAYSPAASRSSQTVTAGATFTQADIAFSIRKIGLLNTATDAGTGLIDIIGGSNNSTFTIDLTGVSSFSLLMQVQVTAAAT